MTYHPRVSGSIIWTGGGKMFLSLRNYPWQDSVRPKYPTLGIWTQRFFEPRGLYDQTLCGPLGDWVGLGPTTPPLSSRRVASWACLGNDYYKAVEDGGFTRQREVLRGRGEGTQDGGGKRTVKFGPVTRRSRGASRVTGCSSLRSP